MKTRYFVLAITIAALMNSYAATAASINGREHSQRADIKEGLADGSLTGREAKHLSQEQARLERREQAFKSDDVITARERARMQASLNRSRSHIYRQRHDDQVQQ